MVVIFGIHAVSEALKSGARSFDYVGISRERHDQRMQRIIDDCRASGVQVRFLPREELDRTANTNTHQGVIAVTSSKQYADVDMLLEQRNGEHSFLVVLDGIEDPHNLGALIRTADGAGADGVIIPERRAVGLDRHRREGVRWSVRAPADRPCHQHLAHPRRAEGPQRLDRRTG